jgi:hypothetical protein
LEFLAIVAQHRAANFFRNSLNELDPAQELCDQAGDHKNSGIRPPVYTR